MLLYTLCMHRHKSAFFKTIKSRFNYTMRSVILHKAPCIFFKWVTFQPQRFNRGGVKQAVGRRTLLSGLISVFYTYILVYIYIYIYIYIPPPEFLVGGLPPLGHGPAQFPHYVPSKHQQPLTPHRGVTSQKTRNFSNTTVSTSDLVCSYVITSPVALQHGDAHARHVPAPEATVM
jgi:hypothetical protein